MNCQFCGHPNASVHISENLKSLHLCAGCAKKHLNQTIPDEQGPTLTELQAVAGLSQLASLAGSPQVMVVQIPAQGQAMTSQIPDLTCSVCGCTYKEFLTQGLFGCPGCYDSFSGPIKAHHQRVKKAPYAGKFPARAFKPLKKKGLINDLKEQLDREVKEENYVKAAQLRDTIRNLEDEVE